MNGNVTASRRELIILRTLVGLLIVGLSTVLALYIHARKDLSYVGNAPTPDLEEAQKDCDRLKAESKPAKLLGGNAWYYRSFKISEGSRGAILLGDCSAIDGCLRIELQGTLDIGGTRSAHLTVTGPMAGIDRNIDLFVPFNAAAQRVLGVASIEVLVSIEKPEVSDLRLGVGLRDRKTPGGDIEFWDPRLGRSP